MFQNNDTPENTRSSTVTVSNTDTSLDEIQLLLPDDDISNERENEDLTKPKQPRLTHNDSEFADVCFIFIFHRI